MIIDYNVLQAMASRNDVKALHVLLQAHPQAPELSHSAETKAQQAVQLPDRQYPIASPEP